MRSIYITQNEAERLRELIELAGTSSDFGLDELSELRTELKCASIVSPQTLPADVITMGSEFGVQDLKTREERNFVLVYPQAVDREHGHISILSAPGAAFLGGRVGEIVDWPLPDGSTRQLKIVKVARPLETVAGSEPATAVK